MNLNKMILGGKEVKDVLTVKDFKQLGGYEAQVQAVYDGDTITCIYYNEKIGRFVVDKFRLARINAAEIRKERGKVETEQEKLARLELALKAKSALVYLVAGKPILVEASSLDPYQRMISEVYVSIESVPRNITIDPACICEKNGSRYLNVSTYLLKNEIVKPYP